MDRGDAAALFVAFEYPKNIPHVLNGFRQGSVDYREPMIFDVGEAHCLRSSGEIGFISTELVDFSEINERPDTSHEQRFYLLFRDTRTPGVLASKKERCGPVRVRDWAFEDDVEGSVLLLGKQDIDMVLSDGERSAR